MDTKDFEVALDRLFKQANRVEAPTLIHCGTSALVSIEEGLRQCQFEEHLFTPSGLGMLFPALLH